MSYCIAGLCRAAPRHAMTLRRREVTRRTWRDATKSDMACLRSRQMISCHVGTRGCCALSYHVTFYVLASVRRRAKAGRTAPERVRHASLGRAYSAIRAMAPRGLRMLCIPRGQAWRPEGETAAPRRAGAPRGPRGPRDAAARRADHLLLNLRDASPRRCGAGRAETAGPRVIRPIFKRRSC